MTLTEIMAREKRIAGQIDGHYCYDWDEMAVSAWTPEYGVVVTSRRLAWGALSIVSSCGASIWAGGGPWVGI